MPEPFREPSLQSPDRPDTFYAFVVGLYVAALLSPAILVAVALTGASNAGVLYVVLLAIFTVLVTTVTWGVTRWHGLAERLGATPGSWLFAISPLLAAVAYVATMVSVENGSASGAGAAGFFLSLGAAFVGTGLAAMSRSRYAKAVVDEDGVTCEWRAGWPKRQRRLLQGTAITVMLLVPLSWVVESVFDVEWAVTIAQILFVPAIAAANLGDERAYRVTEAGLERRYPAVRTVHRWDAFENYTMTDDVIVVRWRSWWRPSIRCARSDIDDVDAAVDALDRYLPQA